MNAFYEWLNREIAWRGWTQAEFSRRAGLSTGHLSRIAMGSGNPGTDFCAAVAHALGLPPSRVFRMAGLLPSYPVEDNARAEMMEFWDSLNQEQQRQIFETVKALAFFNAMEEAAGERPQLIKPE